VPLKLQSRPRVCVGSSCGGLAGAYDELALLAAFLQLGVGFLDCGDAQWSDDLGGWRFSLVEHFGNAREMLLVDLPELFVGLCQLGAQKDLVD
jgi:hypothetical protein